MLSSLFALGSQDKKVSGEGGGLAGQGHGRADAQFTNARSQGVAVRCSCSCPVKWLVLWLPSGPCHAQLPVLPAAKAHAGPGKVHVQRRSSPGSSRASLSVEPPLPLRLCSVGLCAALCPHGGQGLLQEPGGRAGDCGGGPAGAEQGTPARWRGRAAARRQARDTLHDCGRSTPSADGIRLPAWPPSLVGR